MNHPHVKVFGFASGLGGPNTTAGLGPIKLSQSHYLSDLSKKGLRLDWVKILQPKTGVINKTEEIQNLSESLALSIKDCIQEKHFFINFGGDHSCAIGTWSGASASQSEPMGLIWIDAHMDSHTLETSETGNIHGMPLACLLGYGDIRLTNLLNKNPKILPENLCLIGIRSYEKGESQLLESLNVKIFYMDEIKSRGLDAVMKEAIQIVTRHTQSYGVTIDIDSVDPEDAPGTGVAEADGIKGVDLCHALTLLSDDPRLMGFEIAEFDPTRDKDEKTEKLIAEMIKAITIK